ncbi:MAG: deoxyribonuclease IV [Phycisphaerae bacterium]
MSPCPHADAHRFGAHLSVAGGMHHALLEARRLGMDTVQVFVKNQRQWRGALLREDDVQRWSELLHAPRFGPAVAHATYLINLASADAALRRRSAAAFEDELLRCERLMISYLVLHPGAAGEQPRAKAVRRVANELARILGDHPAVRVMPLLETTAGQGTALGACFGELAEIIGLSRAADRIGVCVDTCHVFAAGYDIRRTDAYERMVFEAERTVGLERIRCFHLNDSRGECGSRLDRHAHIGHGRIGTAGFRHVLRDARFAGVPMILETPKGTDERGVEWDARNLRRLRRIARGVG